MPSSAKKKLNREHSVVDMIDARKLQLFGHICRMEDSRLVKSVMLGMVDGYRPRLRPPRQWIDITEWSG